LSYSNRLYVNVSMAWAALPAPSCSTSSVSLKVRDGAGGYWRVECGTCVTGWQVPHYAESVG
jgi:hypothetical protein